MITSEKKAWQMLHDAECNTFWLEVDQLLSPLQGFSFRSAAASACHDGPRRCCCCCCCCCSESTVHSSSAVTHSSLRIFFFLYLFFIFLNETVMRSRTRRRSLLVCAPRSQTSTSVLSSFTNISHAT